jgi:hypothetical protein
MRICFSMSDIVGGVVEGAEPGVLKAWASTMRR